MTSLAGVARSVLLPLADVSRLGSLRRSTVLFSQGQPADAFYFLEEGLVKLTRTSEKGGRMILSVCGPGHAIGEEVLRSGEPLYTAEAEVLSPALVHRIPRDTLQRALSEESDLSAALIRMLIEQKLQLANKVELLCLHDVEYRILHYLADLAKLVKPLEDGAGYQLPITQLELADLIGATRETTSTTLNQLERRGLVQLSRRLLTIPSPATLRAAARAKDDGHGPLAAAAAIA